MTGGAGFAANEDLTVKKIDEGKAAEAAGVALGMKCTEFKGEILGPEMTWTALRGLVKAAAKPWTFRFETLVPEDEPAVEEEDDDIL